MKPTARRIAANPVVARFTQRISNFRQTHLMMSATLERTTTSVDNKTFVEPGPGAFNKDDKPPPKEPETMEIITNADDLIKRYDELTKSDERFMLFFSAGIDYYNRTWCPDCD